LLKAEGVTTWPVAPEVLAAGAGLEVRETENGFPPNAYGALVKTGASTFCIVLSTRCPNSGHRRFTLGHELGHYHMPGHLDVLFEQAAAHFSRAGHFRGRKEWWEVEADAFAAELLVPTAFAKAVIGGAPRGLPAVRALVEAFDISLSCAAVRYAAMTADPVLVVLSYQGSVEWTCCADCVRDHRWSRRLGRGEWAPPRSATTVLTRSPEAVREGGLRTMMDVLPSWIEDAPAVPVREEALGLGGYGRVLTVLSCDELPTPEEQEARERRREARPGNWREGMRSWSWDDPDDVR
jgi:hypothetical protein